VSKYVALTFEERAAVRDDARRDVVAIRLAEQIKRALVDGHPLDPEVVGTLVDRVLSAAGITT